MKIIIAALFLIATLGGCTVYTHGVEAVEMYPPGAEVRYKNPPIDPGIAWQSWYTFPDQPGFVFFLGADGQRYSFNY